MTQSPVYHYSPPPLWRRFAALVYDLLLLTAISMLYGAIITALRVIIVGTPDESTRITWSGLSGTLVTVGWIFTLSAFYCFFWVRSGQTLGMKTWKLILTQQDSLDRPTLKQCIIRALVGPLSLLLCGAGYLLALVDSNKQTLHDKLSKTRTFVLTKANDDKK